MYRKDEKYLKKKAEQKSRREMREAMVSVGDKVATEYVKALNRMPIHHRWWWGIRLFFGHAKNTLISLTPEQMRMQQVAKPNRHIRRTQQANVTKATVPTQQGEGYVNHP